MNGACISLASPPTRLVSSCPLVTPMHNSFLSHSSLIVVTLFPLSPSFCLSFLAVSSSSYYLLVVSLNYCCRSVFFSFFLCFAPLSPWLPLDFLSSIFLCQSSCPVVQLQITSEAGKRVCKAAVKRWSMKVRMCLCVCWNLSTTICPPAKCVYLHPSLWLHHVKNIITLSAR